MLRGLGIIIVAVAACGNVGWAQEGESPDLPIIGYWSFDGIEGAEVTSEGSAEVAGELIGDVTVVESRLGQALRFGKGKGQAEGEEGAGPGALRLAASEALRLQPPFTIAAWIHPDETGQMEIFNLKSDSESWGYRLRFNWTKVELDVGDGEERGTRIFSEPTAAPVGVWSHVAAAHDGENVAIFVNGREVARHPAPGQIVYPDRGNLQATIGNYLGRRRDVYPFSGEIDEVYVIGAALDAEQVLGLAMDGEE